MPPRVLRGSPPSRGRSGWGWVCICEAPTSVRSVVLKPSVQVNHVPHRAPAELDGRRPELEEERDADAEVGSGLFLGEAADRGQGAGRIRRSSDDCRSCRTKVVRLTPASRRRDDREMAQCRHRRGLPDTQVARTCFITRHVCDRGEVGCRSRRRARSNML